MQATLQSKPAHLESDAKTPAQGGPVLLDASMLRHVVGGVGAALTPAAQKASTAGMSKAASTDAPRGRWC
jgi:hypothetical protein